MSVAVFEFRIGRLTDFANRDVKIECHAGERVISIDRDIVALDIDHRDDDVTTFVCRDTKLHADLQIIDAGNPGEHPAGVIHSARHTLGLARQ